MKKLFIVGASALGREIESCLNFIPEDERDWELVGFLDIKQPEQNFISDYPYLGDENTYDFCENDHCLIAIANPSVREKVFNKLRGRVKFFTFIAHNVLVAKHTTIKEGVIICPNSVISTNVILETGVFINGSSNIGHDCILGDFSSIMAGVIISGNCRLGKRVFVGSNAVLIPSVTSGDDSVIGAGSVVIKSVKSGDTVFGSPARKIN